MLLIKLVVSKHFRCPHSWRRKKHTEEKKNASGCVVPRRVFSASTMSLAKLGFALSVQYGGLLNRLSQDLRQQTLLQAADREPIAVGGGGQGMSEAGFLGSFAVFVIVFVSDLGYVRGLWKNKCMYRCELTAVPIPVTAQA